MRNGFHLSLAGALGLVLCAWTARADEGTRYTFDTADGVTLEGTFYKADPVAPAKPKDATVLLLHDIDKQKGGGSHQDGWDDLAKKLSEEGYSVFSFDFRGFGNSHSVAKDFWDPAKNPHNFKYVKGAKKSPLPKTINHDDFDNNAGEYYPFLVNDIAAAKSFLDRRSDAGQANTSNLVLIGAGEGATLGAMWMASQWYLQKFTGRNPKTGALTLDEPEGRDEAGAVWLSIQPRLGGQEAVAVRRWLADANADNTVPMAFLYGEKDEAAAKTVEDMRRAIANRLRDNNTKDDDVKAHLEERARVKAIEGSKLVGSALLGVDKTQDLIVSSLGKLIDQRGHKEARTHAINKEDIYYWTFAKGRPIEAKTQLDDTIRIVPADVFVRVTSGS
jgi:pimeloyl-ACP methyl ester carboxylesterase